MKLKTISYLASAAVIAVVGGTILATTVLAPASDLSACISGRVAGGAIGGPFELVNTKGEVVTDKDVITAPTLVYFGYTFCPDVCPVDSSRNALAVEELEEQYDIKATPVFVSVDPRRDTPERLDEFTSAFHDRMLALTGTPEQLKATAAAYKTYYNVPANPEDEFYLVDHQVFTYLMFPQTGFVDFFTRETTPEQIAKTVACYVNEGVS